MRMIAENRPLLDTLAHTLLENEVLEREDITRLVTEYRDGGPSGNGDAPKDRPPVVPIPEPGAAQVAASERLEDQPGGDSPAQ
jgi:hypothetical protein